MKSQSGLVSCSAMGELAISFAESAVADPEVIRIWYAEQGVPEIGVRMLEGILRRVESLQRNPDIGRVVPEFDQPWLRELIFPPFRIVYRREATRVRVVRVWRSERSLALPDQD
jgi:toxin ParE1/3/4